MRYRSAVVSIGFVFVVGLLSCTKKEEVQAEPPVSSDPAASAAAPTDSAPPPAGESVATQTEPSPPTPPTPTTEAPTPTTEAPTPTTEAAATPPTTAAPTTPEGPSVASPATDPAQPAPQASERPRIKLKIPLTKLRPPVERDPVAGTWRGALAKGTFPLIFHFNSDGLGGVDSPVNDFHAPATVVRQGERVLITLSGDPGKFAGILKDGKMTGTWTGKSSSEPMTLKKDR